MCVCKATSPRSHSTAKRSVNKAMPPPTPSKQAANSMPPPPPPPPPSADTHSTAIPSPAAVTASQLSAILDPFFRDTCILLKQQQQQQQSSASSWARHHRPARAATPSAASSTHADSHHHDDQRIRDAMLSGVTPGTDRAPEQDGGDFGGDSTNGGGEALLGFLDSFAWADAVQEMENEKNEMLRLDARVAPRVVG